MVGWTATVPTVLPDDDDSPHLVRNIRSTEEAHVDRTMKSSVNPDLAKDFVRKKLVKGSSSPPAPLFPRREGPFHLPIFQVGLARRRSSRGIIRKSEIVLIKTARWRWPSSLRRDLNRRFADRFRTGGQLAKTLGGELPSSLLLRADQIIE
jgi:hypothetical protein